MFEETVMVMEIHAMEYLILKTDVYGPCELECGDMCVFVRMYSFNVQFYFGCLLA